MAIPVTVSFTITDGKGEQSTLGIHLPSGTTVADAQTFVSGMDNLLAAIIDGGIAQASVTVPLSTEFLLSAAGVNSDVQEKALFVWKAINSASKASLSVPTILESVFVAGSKLIDVTNVDVAAFLAAMLNGITGISPVNIADVDLSQLITAREAWGKYRP